LRMDGSTVGRRWDGDGVCRGKGAEMEEMEESWSRRSVDWIY
jgi:hypothetical protein